MNFLLVAGVAILLCASPVAAATISVSDGDLADWGLTILTGSTGASQANGTNLGATTYPAGVVNTYNVGSNTTNGPYVAGYDALHGTTGVKTVGSFTYRYQVEDTNDLSNSYTISPNLGGQNYDAEFLGVGVDGAYLAIAILTGQRSDNGFANFSPGDIRIDTTAGFFGLEVGGGPGVNGANPTPDSSVVGGENGTTYSIDGSGFTNGFTSLAVQKAGSLWSGATFLSDPFAPPTPTQMTGGTSLVGQLVGNTQYSFAWFGSGSSNQHAVIEALIPLAWFGGAAIESVSWAPSCGNDVLSVWYPANSLLHSPEPATFGLWLIGSFGLLGMRRLRKPRQV